MPVLKNARHERFAQLIATGSTADAAYKEAGYSPDRGAACRLSAKVNKRVAELLNKAASKAEITLERLTDMLLEDRELARTNAQVAAAVSACEKIGRLYGMFVDRTELTGKDGSPLQVEQISPLEEIEDRLKRLSERSEAPAQPKATLQ